MVRHDSASFSFQRSDFERESTTNSNFVPATEIMLEQDPDLSWDTMYASKLDVIRGKRTGRVMVSFCRGSRLCPLTR
jgi:hypothetical protein